MDGQRSTTTSPAGNLVQVGLDLHDGPLQDLAFVLGHLRALRSDVESGRPRSELAAAAGELELVVAELERTLRALAATLAAGRREPPRPLASGLAAAVERFERRSGLHADVELDGPFDELEDAAADALLHVAAEALENAGRHSGARRVWVRGSIDSEGVTLEIGDDGRGFDSAAPTDRLGLTGMAERMRRCGGRLELDSRPGRGTSVRARIEPSLEPTR